jgi:hypothetical protein
VRLDALVERLLGVTGHGRQSAGADPLAQRPVVRQSPDRAGQGRGGAWGSEQAILAVAQVLA